jgi:hypothetical protein
MPETIVTDTYSAGAGTDRWSDSQASSASESSPSCLCGLLFPFFLLYMFIVGSVLSDPNTVHRKIH